MKKYLSIFMAVLAIIPCAFIFAACGSTPKEEKIVVQHLENVYYLNEELNLENALLKYTDDGRTSSVEITSSMITGFSSKNPGQKTFNLTYKDEIISYNYTVLNLVGRTFNRTKDLNGDRNVIQTYTNEEILYLNRDLSFEIQNIANPDNSINGSYDILTNGDVRLTYKTKQVIGESTTEVTETLYLTKNGNTFELYSQQANRTSVYELV